MKPIRVAASSKRDTSRQLKLKLREQQREQLAKKKKETRELKRKLKKQKPASKFKMVGENKFEKVAIAVERMKKEIGLTNEKVPGIITTTEGKRIEGYRTKRLGFPRFYNQLGIELPAVLGFVQYEYQLGRDIKLEE